MKPAPFDYMRAATLAEAHAVLAAEGGEATVIAGGQTLVPLLSMRMARPGLLVDIMHIPDLAGVVLDGGAIRVGARVRQAELLAWPELAARQPLLALALPWVGHAQTRARGTVCGSIALADPSAELPLVLTLLGGEVELSSQKAKRRVHADEFFAGLMSTAREEEELIEAVRFPFSRPGHGYAFREFGRRHGDFAIVACAAMANADGARLAVGGVADRPLAIDLGDADGSALDDALDAFAHDLEARDDLHATAQYRCELVRRIGREVVAEARRAAPETPSPTLPLSGGGGRAAVGSDHERISRAASRLSAGLRHPVRNQINGKSTQGEAEPRLLLTDYLRHNLGLTGTHVGCEHGVCGACTIEIDGAPARACLMLAVQADGARLRTVEGLEPEPGRLSVLQEAFRRHHALQCGFCTAGMLMSLDYLLRHEPDPDEAGMREFLGGHLCRCTGYVPIVVAALDAAKRLREATNA